MGAALHTRLSASQKFATIDLKVTYLRPLSRASGVMRGTGRVIHTGRRIAYVEARFVIQVPPWRFRPLATLRFSSRPDDARAVRESTLAGRSLRRQCGCAAFYNALR